MSRNYEWKPATILGSPWVIWWKDSQPRTVQFDESVGVKVSGRPMLAGIPRGPRNKTHVQSREVKQNFIYIFQTVLWIRENFDKIHMFKLTLIRSCQTLGWCSRWIQICLCRQVRSRIYDLARHLQLWKENGGFHHWSDYEWAGIQRGVSSEADFALHSIARRTDEVLACLSQLSFQPCWNGMVETEWYWCYCKIAQPHQVDQIFFSLKNIG